MNNTIWKASIEGLTLPSLSRGKHDSVSDGLCLMEMVAYVQRLPHSDNPPCTCPVFAIAARSINDFIKPKYLQNLTAHIPRLIGTVSPEHQRERLNFLTLRMATDFLPYIHGIREFDAADELNKCSTIEEVFKTCSMIWTAAHSETLFAHDLPKVDQQLTLRADVLIEKITRGIMKCIVGKSNEPTTYYMEWVMRSTLIANQRNNLSLAYMKLLDDLLEIGPKPEVLISHDDVTRLANLTIA